MTSKKTKTKKISSLPLAPLAFNEVERLKLLHFSAEIRASNLQLAAKQHEADEYYKTIDPDGKFKTLLGEVNAWKQRVVEYTKSFNDASLEASARLGIDFKTHTWDTETGVVREITKTEETKK